MSAILPLLAFLFLVVIVSYQQQQDWRHPILLSALIWGAAIVLLTEALSVLGLLTFVPLFIFWGLVDIILGIACFQLLKTGSRKGLDWNLGKLPPFLKFALGSVVIIVIIIGLTAAIAPPNNWDSMTYHLGRVVHWIQNGSVAHYSTAITRQLSLAPWPGFTITQFQILSGSDRLANFVQWGSMVGCILGVSLIAKQLGGDLRAQVLAAVICATIPMGILQASSTQTDYVGAFWMVCFVYYGLLSIQDEKRVSYYLPIGVSLGLAILTKGTAYFYLFPFGMWFCFASLYKCGWKAWRPFLIASAIALAINFGYFQRNFEVFGSIFGSSDTYKLGGLSIPIVLSNIVRNIALHLSTPVRSINLILIQGVVSFHQLLGVDANDPRTTFPPGQQFDVHSLINHEDLAGNFLHIVLFFGLSILFLFNLNRFEKRQRYYMAGYLIAIIAGFVLFCALITWSPWRSRLHLPLFVLSAGFLGMVMATVIKPKLANTIATSLIIASLLWVFFNESRPLIANSKTVEENRLENLWNTSRTDQYFINRPELQQPYTKAVDLLVAGNCTNIGLRLGSDTWEYPFWMLLQGKSDHPFRIEHVAVDNASAIQAGSLSDKNTFSPCALVVSGVVERRDREIIFNNQVYRNQWSQNNVSVFIKNQ